MRRTICLLGGAVLGMLLTGRAIRLVGGGLAEVAGVTAARGDEAVESAVALCTDYAGGVSGIRVGVGG